MVRAGLLLLLASQLLVVRPSAAQETLTKPPVLNGGDLEHRATAGYYSLSWRHPRNSGSSLDFLVEESTDEDFESAQTIYIGPDLATFISGKRNGTLYYRVKARPETSADAGADAGANAGAWSPWSDPLAVTTAHHSRARAFAFLGVGALVFLATIALIVAGNRSEEV